VKLPRNVWILGLAALLTDSSSEMIHSVLPLFLVSVLGAGMVTVGIIEGTAESIASVMKVFSGALSDYLGRRKALVVAGYGLSTLAKPLFALAQSSLWVLAARTGDRIGKGIRGAPRDALIADSVPPERAGAAFGFRQSLDTAGAVLGPAAACALVFLLHRDLRTVFWVALAPAAVAVLLLAAGLQEKRSRRTGAVRNPLEWEALARLGGGYWALVAAALVFNLGNSSDAFLLLRARQLGMEAGLVPATLVAMNAAYALTAFPLGHLSDRIGRSGLLVGSFALYALIYLGFALAQAPWQVWLLFSAYGLHLGMSQGVLAALVSDRVQRDQRGTAFGFINLATGITLLPASLLAGFLWTRVSPSAPFFAGSLFALAGTVILLFALRSRQAP